MTEVDDRFVKRGLWLNEAEGAVMGRTITTDARTGNVVIVLLTVSTSVSVAQLWHLFTFAFHQCRSRGRSADGLFWQQQALLRTLPTPSALTIDSMRLWWSWRASHRALRRSLLQILLAITFLVGSLAAGIFSSYLVSTSDIEVLVSGPKCGLLNTTEIGYGYLGTTMPLLVSYAKDCYQAGEFLPARCHNVFARSNVSIAQSRTACPWGPSMCYNNTGNDGGLPAISLDTGMVDASSHLGVNVLAKESVKFRRLTTCSILPLEGHYTISNATPTVDEYLSLQYGSFPVPVDGKILEDTFSFSVSHTPGQLYKADQQLIRLKLDPGEQRVDLLPDLNQTEADVALIAISLKNVDYRTKVDDPFFSAHMNSTFDDGSGNVEYTSDNPAGVIGCSLQYTFCIARDKQSDYCTRPSGLPYRSGLDSQNFPGANERQLALLKLLWTVLWINDITSSISNDHLEISGITVDNVAVEVPNDQWIRELVFAESFAMAGVQLMTVDYAIGPEIRSQEAGNYTDAPSTNGEHILCDAMKARKAGGFANINFFGLVFLLTFATLTTFANLIGLRHLVFLTPLRRALAPRMDSWARDSVFQLQRMVFEAHGEGTWLDVPRDIPITARDEILNESAFLVLSNHINREKEDETAKSDAKHTETV